MMIFCSKSRRSTSKHIPAQVLSNYTCMYVHISNGETRRASMYVLLSFPIIHTQYMWENMSCFAFSKNAYCTSCHSVLTDLHMYLTYSTYVSYLLYSPTLHSLSPIPTPAKAKQKKKKKEAKPQKTSNKASYIIIHASLGTGPNRYICL